MDVLINGLLAALGLGMLCGGGHFLVEGSVSIARKLRISQMIIGLTIVAYGTSTPELAASIAAAGNHADLILGNVIGSNIANIGMVIGISAIFTPLLIEKSTLKKEIPIMLGVSLLVVLLSLDNKIDIFDGFVLISSLLGFTLFTFRRAKKERKSHSVSENETSKSYLLSSGLIALGMGMLYFGSILTVDNAVAIAHSLGISEMIIGITVIAIGTSLPELITSLMAIRKGFTDIGIGNIIGSNIYNILMILGVSSTIASITVTSSVFTDYAVMIGFALVLFAVLKMGFIPRKLGVGLMIAYFVYLGNMLFY